MKKQIHAGKKLDVTLTSIMVKKHPGPEVRISFSVDNGEDVMTSSILKKTGINLPNLQGLSDMFSSDATVITGERTSILFHGKGIPPLSGDEAKTFLSSRVNMEDVAKECLSVVSAFLEE